MAKSKHSAALFEVITRSRPLNRQNRSGILSWIGSLFRPRASEASAPEPAPFIAETSSVPVLPAPVAMATVGGGMSSASPQSAPSPRSSLAPAPREFQFHLSYRGALIAGFALLTVLAIAFVAGMKAVRKRPALTEKTGEQMRDESPRPGVLSVQRGSTDVGRAGGGVVAGGRSPTTRAAHGRDRVAGLNYIIIQSYPDEKTAREAETLLNENGLECTAEKGLSGWGPPTWWSVVCLDGYARISVPECQAQTKKIKELSDKFAKRGSFKAFDPKPYKWKTTAVAHSN